MYDAVSADADAVTAFQYLNGVPFTKATVSYLIYKADGTKQTNWNNPAETILNLKAVAAMYQAILANRQPVAAFEYLNGVPFTKDTVSYLIYKSRGTKQTNWNNPAAVIASLVEYYNVAKPMYDAVSADADAVTAFQYLNGVPFTKATVSYLIYKADGTKQTNWNNPAETILNLKAVAAMYQAILANPTAVAAFEYLNGVPFTKGHCILFNL